MILEITRLVNGPAMLEPGQRLKYSNAMLNALEVVVAVLFNKRAAALGERPALVCADLSSLTKVLLAPSRQTAHAPCSVMSS